MYDPISEKKCEYNLSWCTDPHENTTTIIIVDKNDKHYRIVIPFATIQASEIFEICNDFVKSICANTIIDVSDYF